MTAGAVPYTIIALIVFGIMLLAFGILVDAVVQADVDMSASGLPYSQQHANTMQNLTLMFKGLGFTSVLAAGIFLIKNAVQTSTGET